MGSQSINPKANRWFDKHFESKQTKCQAFIKQMEKDVSQMPINYKSLSMFAT